MSSNQAFVIDARFSYTPKAEEAPISDFLDLVMEHLDELGARDVFIALDQDRREFTLSHVVISNAGESIETVVGKGMGVLRTAFHACEGDTPSWPKFPEVLLYVGVTPAQLPDISAGRHERQLANA